jgi:hypothetical protein
LQKKLLQGTIFRLGNGPRNAIGRHGDEPPLGQNATTGYFPEDLTVGMQLSGPVVIEGDALVKVPART